LFENLDTPAEVWTAFFLTAALSGAMVAGGGFMIWKMVDYFRTWVIWWDQDAGRAQIERRKVKEDFIHRGKGREGRKYYLNDRARMTANKGSAYVIDVHTGMNFTGLNRTQTREILRAAGVKVAEEAGHKVPVQANGHATDEELQALAKYERFVRAIQLKFEACDPGFVFNKAKTNSFGKFFRSKEGEEDWRTRYALPLAVVAGMLIVGIVVMFNAYTKATAGG
jgi:hypothetical protein